MLVTQWVAHYGYLLVAVFLLIEGAGVPVPGETALVTAAALAGRGTLSLGGVIIAGCIGTIAGGHAGYWIGSKGGLALVVRHGRWIGLNETRLAKTRGFFEQHGAKTVLLGRFVAFVRSFVGVFAGLSAMPVRVFTLFNAIGGITWVGTFSVLGYLFGRNLPRLILYIGRVSLLVAIMIALIAGVVILWRWFARNRTSVVASLDQHWEKAATTERMHDMRAHHPVAWRLRSGRFAQWRYLLGHLLLGFVLSLAVIGIFATITEGLIDSTPLTRFDLAVARRLNQSAPASILHTFALLSRLGGRGAMTLLLAAGALFYLLRRNALALAGWCAAFLGGALLDASLRFVVRRSELPFADIVLLGWRAGLASGQALGVVVGCGMLAYSICLFFRGHAARTLVVVLAVALVVAITTARLYLGQHYVSDASAGLAAGLVWLTVCVSGIEIARQRHWER